MRLNMAAPIHQDTESLNNFRSGQFDMRNTDSFQPTVQELLINLKT